MRGAPARAIQELAGHRDIGTTQRYMHLSPAALDAAIRLLLDPFGDDGPLGRVVVAKVGEAEMADPEVAVDRTEVALVERMALVAPEGIGDPNIGGGWF